MKAIQELAPTSGARSNVVRRPRSTNKGTKCLVAALTAMASLAASSAMAGSPAQGGDDHRTRFHMVRSAAAEKANCLSDASATVRITSEGPVERMRVRVKGLPPKTNFDLFVIQVPNAPFGLSWYQGDIETDE